MVSDSPRLTQKMRAARDRLKFVLRAFYPLQKGFMSRQGLLFVSVFSFSFSLSSFLVVSFLLSPCFLFLPSTVSSSSGLVESLGGVHCGGRLGGGLRFF